MIKNALRILLVAGIAAAAFAQQDFSKVEVKVIKVAGSVYMLEGAGGNIGLSVGDDGILMIDDQYAPLAPKIKEAIRTISPKPVKFLLNTHWHGDHTGGNEAFGETAPIIAHRNVRSRMMAGMNAAGRVVAPAPAAALPDLTYDDHVVIHMNGEDIRALHFTRGHTDGDSVIVFPKSNVVHMGDNFFAGRFPFIDLASGGSVTGLIDTVEIVLRDLPADMKVIPGHGPLSTMDDLRKYLQMLRETRGIVEKGVAEGKSLAQLKEAKVLKAYDNLSWQFINADRFLETLFNDVTAK